MKMLRLVCFVIIVATVNLPVMVFAQNVPSSKKDIVRTLGSAMDEFYKSGGGLWLNGGNDAGRQSVVSESCPYVSLENFGFGDMGYRAGEGDKLYTFRFGWKNITDKEVTALKITVVSYDKFQNRLSEVSFSLPDDLEDPIAYKRKNAQKSLPGITLYGRRQFFLQHDKPIPFTVVAYVDNALLSDGTIWKAKPATGKWANSYFEKAAPPKLSAGYNLKGYVDENDGQVPFSVREAYGDDKHFWFAGSYKGGHQYLEINSLGKSATEPSKAMILLENNISTMFPGGSKWLNPDKTPIMSVGHLFKLHLPLYAAVFTTAEVKCIEVSKYHFTFETIPEHHPLQGTAIHGIFKDSSGELWMFQQGQGPVDEAKWRAAVNYFKAEGMWSKNGAQLREILE